MISFCFHKTLEIESQFLIFLGPMGDPDPTDLINLETGRIPFKYSIIDLADWNTTFISLHCLAQLHDGETGIFACQNPRKFNGMNMT